MISLIITLFKNYLNWKYVMKRKWLFIYIISDQLVTQQAQLVPEPCVMLNVIRMAYSQVCSVLESLEQEYRRDEDWCGAHDKLGSSAETDHVLPLISKHLEQKEAFLKVTTEQPSLYQHQSAQIKLPTSCWNNNHKSVSWTIWSSFVFIVHS